MGIQRGRKWDIPSNISPPGERCITLRIPDDDEWENMLYSAIYTELCMWIGYARDEGKNGTKIATRWREAIRTWRDDICPTEVVPDGEEIEEMSNFRIDCNCNVYVKCCDGTEKQILTSDQVKKLILGQPGTGVPQPTPGGGQACYPMVMPANNQRLVPSFVNAGDAVEIQHAQGITSNSHTALWHAADGGWVVAGENVGLPEYNGANPVPSAPTGSLIINFGSGWLALGTGSIVVPGGVSTVQPVLQINDSTIVSDSGELQFDVCVTNNAVVSWSHTLDFTVSTWGFVPDNSTGLGGVWTPGLGWASAGGAAGSEIQHTATSPYTVTKAVLIGTNTSFAPGSGGADVAFVTAGYIVNASSLTVPNWMIDSGAVSVGPDTFLKASAIDGSSSNQNMQRLHIEGTGFDPWPAAPA